MAKQTAGGELLAIVTDHLGTPREMFDEGGGLRWAANYTTWGVVRGVRGPPPAAANDDRRAIYPRGEVPGGFAVAPAREDAQHDCPVRFQGQWEDSASGLIFNRYRYYDSLAAQYVSADPIGLAGGFRPFQYVLNPCVWVDPFGLRLAANAAAGRAWEGKVAGYFRSKGYTVYEQVTVIEVKSGKTIRLDGVVVDKSGKVVGIYDAKASATAPLTANQNLAYPNMMGGGSTIQPVGPNAAAVPGWSGTGANAIATPDIEIIRPGINPYGIK